jgi:serine phosphatase RsbU (regulator of sigma subunit)
MERINRVFWDSSSSEQYATLFFGVYDADSGSLRFVNAGHSAPVLLRKNGTAESLDSTGLPVGMFPAWRGETRDVTLSGGDTLAIVSDGVLEAGQSNLREFGEAGVTNCLRRFHRYPAGDIVQRILNSAAERGVADDITAVVLRLV